MSDLPVHCSQTRPWSPWSHSRSLGLHYCLWVTSCSPLKQWKAPLHPESCHCYCTQCRNLRRMHAIITNVWLCYSPFTYSLVVNGSNKYFVISNPGTLSNSHILHFELVKYLTFIEYWGSNTQHECPWIQYILCILIIKVIMNMFLFNLCHNIVH